MKIQYLKDAPAGKQGDIADVSDIEGSVLVKLGFAQECDETQTDALPTIADMLTEIMLDQAILMNPNDTPVIDDFGDVATMPKPAATDPRPRKTSKKGA